MLEKTIVNQIKNRVEKAGGMAIKLHGGPYQVAGLPDLVVIRNGETIWLEVKTPTGRVTAIQEAMHRKMREHGARVYVVRSADEVM